MRIKKSMFTFLVVVLMMIALPIVAFADETNDATSYLKKSSFELREGDYSSDEIVCSSTARKAGIDIEDAVVQDPTIVEMYEGGGSDSIGYYKFYSIEPLKAGSTTIDITFSNGESATVNVMVKWPYNEGTITYKSVTCKAIKGVITINRSYDQEKSSDFKIKTAKLEVYEGNKTYLNKNITVDSLVKKKTGVYTANFSVSYPSYYDYYNGKDVYLSFIDSDGDETGRSLGYFEDYGDGSGGGFSTYIPDKVSPVKHYDYVRTNKTSGYFCSQNLDIAEYLEGRGEDPTEVERYYSSDSYLMKGWVVVNGKKYNLKIKHDRGFDYQGYYLTGDYFSVSYPIQKLKTKVKFYFIDSDGFTWTQTKIISKTEPATVNFSRVYKNKKIVKVTIKKAKKGDKVSLAIGGKTYTKKVKADKATFKCTFKVKKTKAGQKIKLILKDKKGNTKKTKSGKVYFASKIKKGMTKKQCKLVPGWEHPSDSYVSGSWTTWWYDDNSYLEFYKGKLHGWHY